jgi:hypothetical protein
MEVTDTNSEIVKVEVVEAIKDEIEAEGTSEGTGLGIVDYESDQEKTETEVKEEGSVEAIEIKDEIITLSPEAKKVAAESEILKKRYELYKMFWGLQSFMSSENSKRFEDPAKTAVGAVGTINKAITHTPSPAEVQKESWAELMVHANAVLSAFEEARFTDQEYQAMMIANKKSTAKIDASKTDSTAESQSVAEIEQYFGCKYLTSSELLALQIRDPLFREQLAAQILFYVDYLRSHPIHVIGPPPVAVSSSTISIKEKLAASAAEKAATEGTRGGRGSRGNCLPLFIYFHSFFFSFFFRSSLSLSLSRSHICFVSLSLIAAPIAPVVPVVAITPDAPSFVTQTEGGLHILNIGSDLHLLERRAYSLLQVRVTVRIRKG